MKKLLIVCTLVFLSVASFALERGKEFKENIFATCRVVTSNGSTGTGFAFDKKKVLTAGHVVSDSKDVVVTFFDADGKAKEVKGKVKKFVEEFPFVNDLGLIELEEEAPYFNKVAIGKDEVGEEGYTVGGPYAEVPRIIVIGIFGGKQGLNMGILGVNSAPGASGSAVFNDKHQLVGVLVSGRPDACIYFITAERIKEFLD